MNYSTIIEDIKEARKTDQGGDRFEVKTRVGTILRCNNDEKSIDSMLKKFTKPRKLGSETYQNLKPKSARGKKLLLDDFITDNELKNALTLSQLHNLPMFFLKLGLKVIYLTSCSFLTDDKIFGIGKDVKNQRWIAVHIESGLKVSESENKKQAIENFKKVEDRAYKAIETLEPFDLGFYNRTIQDIKEEEF